jgi:hypothetical protein
MKKLVLGIALTGCMFLTSACARPFEIGWSPGHTARERHRMIARNWDYEGKQLVEDIDHILLLRPASRLTIWNVR